MQSVLKQSGIVAGRAGSKILRCAMQSELSRHVIAVFAFKILMLCVLGYLFYAVIGKPKITPANVTTTLFESAKETR